MASAAIKSDEINSLSPVEIQNYLENKYLGHPLNLYS
jgi:hypothetical protein